MTSSEMSVTFAGGAATGLTSRPGSARHAARTQSSASATPTSKRFLAGTPTLLSSRGTKRADARIGGHAVGDHDCQRDAQQASDAEIAANDRVAVVDGDENRPDDDRHDGRSLDHRCTGGERHPSYG